MMNSDTIREQTLRMQIAEPDPDDRIAAIRAADHLDAHEVAPDILRCFQSESDWEIRKECIVALGHLKYRAGLPTLKRVAVDKTEDLEVRTWAIWAVGELGTTAEDPFLLRLQESKLHPSLGQVTGGAIRKVRLESVRVPKRVIEGRLRPPLPNDRRLRLIVEKLEEMRLGQKGPVSREMISLRQQMRDISEEYFSAYMDWLRRLPVLEDALTNPKVSY